MTAKTTSGRRTPDTSNGNGHVLPDVAPIWLLTPSQAAEALSISPRKLWGMTASGQIPHVRLGRCLRYPVDDLRRWIDEQQRPEGT
jgi:excisionase family DNA binding protein